MKKLLIMVAVLVAGITVQAGNYDWFEGFANSDSTDWNAPGNWFDSDTGSFAATAPEAADWVRIEGASWAGGPASHFPVINSDAGSVTVLSVGGVAGSGTGELTIGTGGSLNVSSDIRLADQYVAGNGVLNINGGTLATPQIMTGLLSGNNATINMNGGSASVSGLYRLGTTAGSTGTLNMSSGLTVAGQLEVGSYGNGVVNLSGDAILHAGIYYSGEQFGVGGTGVIYLEDSAQFLVNGDHVTSGHAGNVIALGWVAAANSGESIVANYDTANSRTVYSVIPEPATLGLFGFIGAGLLWARKRIDS